MFSELWGAVSLAAALFVFQDNCFEKLHSTFNLQDLTTTFWVGPGLYCYAVCCISGDTCKTHCVFAYIYIVRKYSLTILFKCM